MINEFGLVMVSNFSFLIPATIAFLAGFNVFGLLVVLAMVFSILYHANKSQINRRTYLILDYFFAYILLIANTYLIFQPRFNDNVYFYLALVTAVLAVRMYFKDGVEYYKHAYWHILSSVVTLFSLFSAIYK
jgi:hypothetical protein